MFDEWLLLRLELAERPIVTRRDLQTMPLTEFVRRHALLDMIEEKRKTPEGAKKAPTGVQAPPMPSPWSP